MMETPILVALSRQDALRRHLDVVANNMANMNTNGFKAERMLFQDHVVRTPLGRGQIGQSIAYVRDVATVREQAPGALEETGGDLDVALADENAFLVVETPTGDRYTRNGRLRLDENGQLVTSHGLPVLSQQGAPIILGSLDGPVSIARDGTISTDRGDLGRLRVVRFDQPQLMDGVEAGLMSTDQQPQDVERPVVVQGMVERSNVEPILEVQRLITIQRAYDQARSLIDREDDRIGKMMQAYAA
jgi:flagellar basal-body rod protein FlgF